MYFSRQTSRQIKLLSSLLLSLLLLCSQEITLHIHNLSHDHDNYLEHQYGTDTASYHNQAHHSHLSKAHFSHDSSHHEHHDGFVLEFDVSPDGLLKSITNNPLALALLAFVFATALSIPSGRMVQRQGKSKPDLYQYYLLSPPLRAPPRHF